VRTLYDASLPPTLEAGARAAAADCAAVQRSRMRVLADPDGSVRITISDAGAAREVATALVPFTLPGGLGAHKWRDRRLLDALEEVVGGAARVLGAVPLIIDTDGAVLEAAFANVWIMEGADLITPPADGRILPGTTRAALLTHERCAREEAIDLERLAGAEAVFLTSSISGRHPARLEWPALGLRSVEVGG